MKNRSIIYPCGGQTTMTPLIITDAEFTQIAIGLTLRAEASLLLVQYLFVVDATPSHPTRRIAAALMDAARRGIKIRILLNRFSHGRAASTPGAHRPMELTHPNIDLRYHTRGRVLHTKVIVGDKHEVLMGSHNLSHWCLSRSLNLSTLIVGRETASTVLATYDPIFDRAQPA